MKLVGVALLKLAQPVDVRGRQPEQADPTHDRAGDGGDSRDARIG